MLTTMKSWCLPPRQLKFSKFPRGSMPRTPLVSRALALSRQCYTYPQLCPNNLGKKPGAAPGSILVIPVERLLLMVKKSWISYQGITQIHTLSVVQGAGGGGCVGGWNPSPEFLICYSILKRFYLKWKAFDLLNKMRYILGIVALLEACDVTN